MEETGKISPQNTKEWEQKTDSEMPWADLASINLGTPLEIP